jgi:hypothetical protein
MADRHWANQKTTGKLPWTLNGSTASSEQWVLDGDGKIIGFICLAKDRDYKTFLADLGPTRRAHIGPALASAHSTAHAGEMSVHPIHGLKVASVQEIADSSAIFTILYRQ